MAHSYSLIDNLQVYILILVDKSSFVQPCRIGTMKPNTQILYEYTFLTLQPSILHVSTSVVCMHQHQSRPFCVSRSSFGMLHLLNSGFVLLLHLHDEHDQRPFRIHQHLAFQHCFTKCSQFSDGNSCILQNNEFYIIDRDSRSISLVLIPYFSEFREFFSFIFPLMLLTTVVSIVLTFLDFYKYL